jgi:hydroxylaminobenzene mutase
MNDKVLDSARGHRLLQLGIFLFLLGLLTGFAIPVVENPRMGLSSHLEGVLNGMFLVGLGVIWPRLRLAERTRGVTFWLAVYGGFANWLATLLAAFWGAGATMPIAAGANQGGALQEVFIGGLLFSLSFAMLGVCALVLWGLRSGPHAAKAADSAAPPASWTPEMRSARQ